MILERLYAFSELIEKAPYVYHFESFTHDGGTLRNTMRRFLERVGVAQKVLDLTPSIVHTCRVCREWAKPGPSNASNVNIANTFNQQVECDLIFITSLS